MSTVRAVTAAILVGVLTLHSACGKDPPTQRARTQALAEISAVANRMRDALQRGDYGSYLNYFAPDSQMLVVYAAILRIYFGRSSILEEEKGGAERAFEELTSTLGLSEDSIREWPNLSLWANGSVMIPAERGDPKLVAEGLRTLDVTKILHVALSHEDSWRHARGLPALATEIPDVDETNALISLDLLYARVGKEGRLRLARHEGEWHAVVEEYKQDASSPPSDPRKPGPTARPAETCWDNADVAIRALLAAAIDAQKARHYDSLLSLVIQDELPLVMYAVLKGLQWSEALSEKKSDSAWDWMREQGLSRTDVHDWPALKMTKGGIPWVDAEDPGVRAAAARLAKLEARKVLIGLLERIDKTRDQNRAHERYERALNERIVLTVDGREARFGDGIHEVRVKCRGGKWFLSLMWSRD